MKETLTIQTKNIFAIFTFKEKIKQIETEIVNNPFLWLGESTIKYAGDNFNWFDTKEAAMEWKVRKNPNLQIIDNELFEKPNLSICTTNEQKQITFYQETYEEVLEIKKVIQSCEWTEFEKINGVFKLIK